jgi:hypothetical protein
MHISNTCLLRRLLGEAALVLPFHPAWNQRTLRIPASLLPRVCSSRVRLAQERLGYR